MKIEEKNLANINSDYWFLRDNGVSAITAIYMCGLAYDSDIVVVRRGKQ